MDVKLRPVTLAEAEATAAMIRECDAVIRTPLVKLNTKGAGDTEIYLKLENVQSISSFKVRGAAAAILPIDKAEVTRRGVFTCSAGNMGQGVAKFAQVLGVACTVVVPDTAPRTKLDAMVKVFFAVILGAVCRVRVCVCRVPRACAVCRVPCAVCRVHVGCVCVCVLM